MHCSLLRNGRGGRDWEEEEEEEDMDMDDEGRGKVEVCRSLPTEELKES